MTLSNPLLLMKQHASMCAHQLLSDDVVHIAVVRPHGGAQEVLPVRLLVLVLSILEHIDHQRAARLQHTPVR